MTTLRNHVYAVLPGALAGDAASESTVCAVIDLGDGTVEAEFTEIDAEAQLLPGGWEAAAVTKRTHYVKRRQALRHHLDGLTGLELAAYASWVGVANQGGAAKVKKECVEAKIPDNGDQDDDAQ